ncbi:glycosyl hydrolase 53 family protein [Pseudactinotalea sp. Z1732]|uniref:glycosyl hydrolase 53 family protein n=1 Tax=Micrococcales TaxID=85006 RepID=UPI003C79905F
MAHLDRESSDPTRLRGVAVLAAAGALLAAPLAAGAAAPPGTAAAAPTSTSVAPPAATSQDGPVESTIHVDPVAGLPEDFINGVDISSILSLEESGVTFHDAAGAGADIFELLAAHDVNYVRIRVWNDPFDADGNGYGGGNVGVDRAITIGQRATAAGMRVLVNFHYSDFWADPAKQMAPKAWQGFDGDVEQTAAAVHDFTTGALEAFEEAGVDVGMVQVGNETNNGVAGVTGLDNLARVLAAGAEATRQVLPDALIAVHFTNPETEGRYAAAAAALQAADVDYDVFASSYYSFWHGSLTNLTNVLNEIRTEYGKDVLVVETSWAYTPDDGDGHPNSVNSDTYDYPLTEQGQADAIRDVIEATVNAQGIGVFYWEPAWLPVGPPDQWEANAALWEAHGSGWATSHASDYDPADAGQYYGGTSWDNQALFDFDGHPLETLNIFTYARTGATAPREVTAVEPVELIIGVGDPVELPETVRVRFNDRSTEDQGVTWADASHIAGPGTYTVEGTTETGLSVTATVIVELVNYVLNPSFEDPDTSMWIIEGTGAQITGTSNTNAGERAVDFWHGSDYTFTITQHLRDLPPGRYALSAVTQGDAAAGAEMTLSATTSAGEWSEPLELVGWQNYRTTAVEGIEVSDDGEATIQASFSLPGGAWGTFDDVRLVPADAEEGPADPLEAVIALRDALAEYRAAGAVDGPIAHRLTNATNQAQQHLESGRTEPAEQALTRLIRHLDSPKPPDTLTEEARVDLRGRAVAILDLL